MPSGRVCVRVELSHAAGVCAVSDVAVRAPADRDLATDHRRHQPGRDEVCDGMSYAAAAVD